MGVYIKGMTFPKSCSVCDFKSVMGYCRRMPPDFYGCTRDDGHPDWCPLGEVKEPHGDLIDKEVLKHDLSDFYNGIVTARRLIDAQDVVIEAEGEKE